MKSLYAADIRENQPIDDMFLVAQKNHGVTKGGSSYLTLKLLDRSGEIEARIWDRADDLGRGFERNDFVRVRGQATLYQGKMQIRVQDVMRVDHGDDAAALAAAGLDVESQVLSRAVRWHAESRVLLNGHKTIVFR